MVILTQGTFSFWLSFTYPPSKAKLLLFIR